MRRRVLIILSLLIISFILISFFKVYIGTLNDEPLSPLPPSLSISKNDQVSSLDLWIPSILSIGNFLKGTSDPQITAGSAIVYDLTTEKVLYQKNPRMKFPMASLTKVMTAIIALENKKPGDSYLVREENLVGENSMGLTAGEVLTLEELLYGLILPSGNDAAEVLASNYYLGREKFISSMNAKARSFGLTDTNFTNPSGLEGEGEQYSTSYDLLVISKHAMENFDTFRKVVSTFSYEIPDTPNHKYFYLENETNLLTTYPGVAGIKTGYTTEAGLCLITYLEYKDHKIIAVILGSENRRGEMIDLLDYSLKSQGITPPEHD